MTHRPNAITHTQEYTVLHGVVRHTFIIFGLFTRPNLCPLTQNPGDATGPASAMVTRSRARDDRVNVVPVMEFSPEVKDVWEPLDHSPPILLVST